ncbi:MAG: toprim domain-containing protein, partial [Thermodesulfobacteriota bacterium]|nr:toprim domain-containing protein [Thermodesulfobacteriota bacterium]
SISKETISEFSLGYAPDEWDGLIGFLMHGHVGLDKAEQAGLIIPKKNGGYYDRFRGRIIFPIFDLRQKVVGFGGRVLDGSLPKYLNTPETSIFHKGEFLYGLHASFNSIREKHRAIIVEGYMDWLALRKHGVMEVVATLGTALTAKQVRKLKGYAREAVVVFDSDEAGKAAALKSLPIFSNEGLSGRAVVLPDGHDPDSFVNKSGFKPLLDLLDQASSMFDFYLEQKLTPKNSDEEKVRALKEILPTISEIRDFTLRSLYVRRVSERAGVKEEIVWSELKRSVASPPGKTVERNLKMGLPSSGVAKRYHNDVVFLNLLIHYPHIVPRLAGCEWRILFSDPVIVEVVGAFFEKYHKEGRFSPDELAEDLNSEAARKQFMEALVQPAICSDDEVELCVVTFEERVHEMRRKASVRSAGERGDIEGLNELLKAKIAKSARGLRT